MAIDDLAAGGANSVGPAAGAAKDNVSFDFLSREDRRQQGECQAMIPAKPMPPIEGEGANIDTGELSERGLRGVQGRVQGGVGEGPG